MKAEVDKCTDTAEKLAKNKEYLVKIVHGIESILASPPTDVNADELEQSLWDVAAQIFTAKTGHELKRIYEMLQGSIELKATKNEAVEPEMKADVKEDISFQAADAKSEQAEPEYQPEPVKAEHEPEQTEPELSAVDPEPMKMEAKADLLEETSKQEPEPEPKSESEPEPEPQREIAHEPELEQNDDTQPQMSQETRQEYGDELNTEPEQSVEATAELKVSQESEQPTKEANGDNTVPEPMEEAQGNSFSLVPDYEETSAQEEIKQE